MKIFDIFNTDKNGLMRVDELRELLYKTYGRYDLVDDFIKRKGIG